MEIGGNMNINMLGHDQNCTISSRGQNGNNNHLWDIWGGAAATTNNIFYSADAVTVAASREASSSAANSGHALIMGHPLQLYSDFYSGCGGGGGGGGVAYGLDPHLMCLKLGKRHYFEDHAAPPPLLDRKHVARFPVGMMSKKGKAAAAAAAGAGQLYGGDGPALAMKVVPRCQVDGCHAALINAKEYHRRHKVCEMHSKASKVTVSGQVQRFCQQCSRFHAVSEFDESKRSCRRRLAGHNERRRKSSHDSLPGSSPQGRALSLLSSKTTNFHSWVSPSSDLSSRSSAALRELIAENRASILARQLVFSSDRHWDSTPHNSNNNNNNNATEDLFADHGGQPWSSFVQSHQHQMFSDHNNQYGAHLTLDLRQAPAQAAYGFLPERARTKAEEDQECDLWNSFQGTNLV